MEKRPLKLTISIVILVMILIPCIYFHQSVSCPIAMALVPLIVTWGFW